LVQERCWICGSDILPEDNFCRKCGVELISAEKEHRADRRLTDANRQAPVGIFLITVGAIVGLLSYFMAIVPMLAFGLASFLIGIMVLYLPESRGSIAGRLATDSSLPSLLNIEKLLEDLDLDERGIYIPASGLGVCPKVFVPLAQTPATERPPLGLGGSRRIFVTVGKNPEDRGILLDAPGGQILFALENSLRADLAKVELGNLGTDLNSAFESLGIAKVTTLEHQDTTITIEMKLTALLELEERLRNLAPRLVAQVGTPIASALAAAVSKVTGKYVKFKSAVLQVPEKKLTINLKLSE